MRNPFKKYGHMKTRYDQLKKFDNRLKNKIQIESFDEINKYLPKGGDSFPSLAKKRSNSFAKLYVVSNPEFKKFIDTNLGIPYKPKVETVKQWSERLKCQKL